MFTSVGARGRIAAASAALAVFVAGLAGAQPRHSTTTVEPQAAPATAALVVSEPVADLGEIALGASQRALFRIENTGTVPVDLSFGRLPPGLVARTLESPIPPGGSGVAVVDLDTYTVNEPETHFTIATSSAAQPRLDLAVRARVRAFVQPTPADARFAFVQFEPAGSTYHTIFATDVNDLVVTGVESPVPFIAATATELTGKALDPDLPGRQWQVRLTIAADAPVGPIAGFVKVTTNHAKQPLTLFAVSGFVRPLFAVTPPALPFGEIRHDPSATLATLIVKNFASKAMAILSAAVDIDGIVASVTPTDAGRSWRVSLKTTDALKAGAFRGTLTLATDSRDVPELRVPITGVAVGIVP